MVSLLFLVKVVLLTIVVLIWIPLWLFSLGGRPLETYYETTNIIRKILLSPLAILGALAWLLDGWMQDITWYYKKVITWMFPVLKPHFEDD